MNNVLITVIYFHFLVLQYDEQNDGIIGKLTY